MNTIEMLKQFVRQKFDEETHQGFPHLGRIPDTVVRRFIDNYNQRDSDGQLTLANEAVNRGLLSLTRAMAIPQDLDRGPEPLWAKTALNPTFSFSNDPRYYSVPMLRLCLAQAKINRHQRKPSGISKEIESLAASTRGVKAPELRKRVRASLNLLIGSKPVSAGGGQMDYSGQLHGSQIAVEVNYGKRLTQMTYSIEVRGKDPRTQITGLTFESLLGVGFGHWNFITEDNVEDSIKLLSEIVVAFEKIQKTLGGVIAGEGNGFNESTNAQQGAQPDAGTDRGLTP